MSNDVKERQRDQSFIASAYPPLELPHPLEVFPPAMPVYATPFFTFELDTVARVLVDMSSQMLFRSEAPGMLSLLKKAVSAGRGLHRPTVTTQRLARQTFGKFISEESLERLLAGQEWLEEASPGWHLALTHTGEWADTKLRGVVERFVFWESRAVRARGLVRAGDTQAAEALMRQWFGEGMACWVTCAPRALPKVLVLLETTLDTLANFEQSVHPVPDHGAEDHSYFEGLLAPGRRPLSHWLQEVTSAAGLEGFPLTRLADAVANTAQYRGKTIQPGLLHDWSSSLRVVLPRHAVRPLLTAVTDDDRRDALYNRYHIARLFTFLCDLTRAATPDPQPSWEQVQATLLTHYSLLYSTRRQLA